MSSVYKVDWTRQHPEMTPSWAPGSGYEREVGIVAKGLSRAAVIAAALALVDEEGLGALSMRRLATRLGVDPMAAYRHVPNKDALLDGIVEAAVGGIDLHVTGDDWRQNLREAFDRLWHGLRAHPNVLPLLGSRTWVTGASLDVLEAGMALIAEAGVADHEATIIANSSTLFLISLATAAASATPEASARSRELLASLDPGTYPHLVRAIAGGQAASYDDMRRWWAEMVVARIEALRGETAGASASKG